MKRLVNVATVVAVALLFAPFVPFGGDAAAQGPGPTAGYTVSFVCPTGSDNGALPNEVIRASCPFKILDDEDSLGSPTIAVNPRNPAEVAWASLHGGGEVNGPTPRSRGPGSQSTGVFTVFTSSDSGYNWQDQPSSSVYPPQPSTEHYGEHVAMAADGDGHLYGAGVYSVRSNSAEPFGSRMLLWKWDTAAHNIDWVRGSSVKPLAPSNITWASVTYLPRPGSIFFDEPPYEKPNDYSWANNTTTPSPSPTDSTTSPPEENETVVATWLETAVDPTRPLEGKVSRLRAAWTGTGNDHNRWEVMPVDQTVGPCKSISNGVAWQGGVYVACVIADEGAYNHRARPQTGQIDMWRVVPSKKRMELVAETPLTGGNPRLAASSDGRFALATVERYDAQHTRVGVTFSWFGKRWGSVSEIGDFVRMAKGPIMDARIQVMAYVKGSRVLQLIYGEVYPPVGIDLTAPRAPTTAQFAKSFVAMNECRGLLAPPLDLNVGVVHQYSPVKQSGTDFSLFDDLVDGLTLIPDPGRPQREFIAYADMGVVNYAEVKESFAPPCPLESPGFSFQAGSPAQPNPVPAGGVSPTAVGAGLVAGTLGLVMLARLVRLRRTSKVEAPAGMKK